MGVGRQFKQNGGFNSMLNKLKRAALGAHTPHDKATAASKPVPMPLPAQVRILMSQHIGAPAKACVKKGDEVFVGTKIGVKLAALSLQTSLQRFRHRCRRGARSVCPMADVATRRHQDRWQTDRGPRRQAPEVTDKASFLAAVRECGLSGFWAAQVSRPSKLQPNSRWIPC